MKANDTQIRVFLEGSKQFNVPLFQREYVWDKNEIERLWADVLETETNHYKMDHHFFGSFVTMPTPSGASTVSEFTIVDGQQRLTTIYIILATIRERIKELNPEHPTEIDALYLLNQHHPEHKYKLIPTQNDRNTFYKIMDGKDIKESKNRISETYNFFKEKFGEIDETERLDSIKTTILSNFSIVDIMLEERDDPYLIFETLNGTGIPLTQADLVRNYLFMKVSPKNQEDTYKNIWLPLQKSIEGEKNLEIKKRSKDKRMDNFIRHYLAMDGDLPTFNRLYITLKELVDKNHINQEGYVIWMMERLKKFSEYYSKFLYPKNETKKELRIYFEKFNRLNSTTAYPLLLKLYDNYKNSNVDFYIEDLMDCLHAIETFVVRRAVCGIPVNALNSYFPRVYGTLDEPNIAQSLKETFINGTGTSRMPDKAEFRKCLKDGTSRQVYRYILEEIERYPENKEVVKLSEMQLEHIMPQTINKEWKKDLGDNWEVVHNRYLDAIGNLTLTGYNQEYSNKRFIEKRDMKNGFKESNLKLNRHLSQQKEWGEKQIKDRSNELAKLAVNIWDF